ncbi:hypothetical protein SKAU_G00376780 [Synaphobranchus kaupii]|uniref:Succinate dehydrogenase assembly factor 3 n=1 Tax=Synaphobranchus kaupii TaxID=118154 RepID=A0A9Q1ECW6_SYNKA|nr:hypothetical protein SKAU_G00376780 [Synaphobranchus kaupii]
MTAGRLDSTACPDHCSISCKNERKGTLYVRLALTAPYPRRKLERHMANPAHVSKVRALYKRILQLHRFLPIDLRALGDQYVKDEFRRNKSASPVEVKSFMTEWENYRNTLQTQVLESASGGVAESYGAVLSDEKMKQFQEEQFGQLYELMLESTKPNPQFHIQGDGSQKPRPLSPISTLHFLFLGKSLGHVVTKKIKQ